MLKRVALLGLLAALTVGNPSSSVAAGWGVVAALTIGQLLSSAGAESRRGGEYQPPYYRRPYRAYGRDYGWYGHPVYDGYGSYGGGYGTYPAHGGYGSYGGAYGGYGCDYDGYGW